MTSQPCNFWFSITGILQSYVSGSLKTDSLIVAIDPMAYNTEKAITAITVSYTHLESNAANTYATYSIPMTFFIDSEGYMVARATGALDSATLKKGLDMIE